MKHFSVIVVLSLAFAMLACSFGSTLFTPTISGTSTASPTSILPQPTLRPAATSEGYIPQTVVPPTLSGTDVDSRLPEIYRQVIPGVVSILTVGDQGGGLGSGFVFDKNGHIHHALSVAVLDVDKRHACAGNLQEIR